MHEDDTAAWDLQSGGTEPWQEAYLGAREQGEAQATLCRRVRARWWGDFGDAGPLGEAQKCVAAHAVTGLQWSLEAGGRWERSSSRKSLG